ncbi:ComF family protein [Paenibacillus sp. GCM10023250]|uniref:ComF family protein n=1 Tax=Paenibacillus sp. GCM10023250 TaxID=3252648 RepID=UPI003623CEA5
MTISELWQSIRKAFPLFTSLLAAGGSGCVVCGARCEPGGQGALSSLCKRCIRSIPWIARVYCPVCGRPERCPDCVRRTRTAFVANRSAVRYDATIREWIALYKYSGHEALEPVLGEMLNAACHAMQAEMSRHQRGMAFDGIVPVPVSGERLMERGFNQAARLAEYVASGQSLPCFDILRRTRHSEKQSHKTRGARLRDTRGLFEADAAAVASMAELVMRLRAARASSCPPASSANLPIRLLLIDDVYTTGSTVNACAQAIASGVAANDGVCAQGAEIYVLTLARS